MCVCVYAWTCIHLYIGSCVYGGVCVGEFLYVNLYVNVLHDFYGHVCVCKFVLMCIISMCRNCSSAGRAD